MKQFWTIFKFELKGYLKNKIFIGLTAFLVIAIALAMTIPTIISSISGTAEETPKENMPIIYVRSDDDALGEIAAAYFSQSFQDNNVKVFHGSVDEMKEEVLSGNAECAFDLKSASEYTYYVNNFTLYDYNAEIASETLLSVYRYQAMITQGISEEEAADILSAQIKSETVTLGKDQTQNFFYTYIMIFALYMVILLYGQMIATSVATEKSSRAMEVLVTSAKPNNMMFGKVLASCVAGLAQLILIFGSAILFYNINKASVSNPIVDSIFNMPLPLFLYMLLFFILGFLIYAFMYGAIGSTASKLEDINTSVMPITFLFIIGFMVTIVSMSSGNTDGILLKICSYVPFTSPMAMFTRIAMSTVLWYEIVISTVILIVSVIFIGILSAKIYKVGVLLYGTQPKLSAIIKTVFKN